MSMCHNHNNENVSGIVFVTDRKKNSEEFPDNLIMTTD